MTKRKQKTPANNARIDQFFTKTQPNLLSQSQPQSQPKKPAVVDENASQDDPPDLLNSNAPKAFPTSKPSSVHKPKRQPLAELASASTKPLCRTQREDMEDRPRSTFVVLKDDASSSSAVDPPAAMTAKDTLTTHDPHGSQPRPSENDTNEEEKEENREPPRKKRAFDSAVTDSNTSSGQSVASSLSSTQGPMTTSPAHRLPSSQEGSDHPVDADTDDSTADDEKDDEEDDEEDDMDNPFVARQPTRYHQQKPIALSPSPPSLLSPSPSPAPSSPTPAPAPSSPTIQPTDRPEPQPSSLSSFASANRPSPSPASPPSIDDPTSLTLDLGSNLTQTISQHMPYQYRPPEERSSSNDTNGTNGTNGTDGTNDSLEDDHV